MHIEKLKKWMNGEYVSPTDFKESLEIVIKQFEEHQITISGLEKQLEGALFTSDYDYKPKPKKTFEL